MLISYAFLWHYMGIGIWEIEMISVMSSVIILGLLFIHVNAVDFVDNSEIPVTIVQQIACINDSRHSSVTGVVKYIRDTN